MDPVKHTKSTRDYAEHMTEPLFVVAIHAAMTMHLGKRAVKDYTIYVSTLSQKEKEKPQKFYPLGYEPERYSKSVEFNFDYQFITLCYVNILNFGKRRIHVIAASCHREGSLLFYDEKYEALFTGDELNCGYVPIQEDLWDSVARTDI